MRIVSIKEERNEYPELKIPSCSYEMLLDYELRSSKILHAVKEFTIFAEFWGWLIQLKTKRKYKRYEKNSNPKSIVNANDI